MSEKSRIILLLLLGHIPVLAVIFLYGYLSYATYDIVITVLDIICIPIWLYGIYKYVKLKNRHGAWTLLGFLWIFGLIVILLLHNKSVSPVEKESCIKYLKQENEQLELFKHSRDGTQLMTFSIPVATTTKEISEKVRDIDNVIEKIKRIIQERIPFHDIPLLAVSAYTARTRFYQAHLETLSALKASGETFAQGQLPDLKLTDRLLKTEGNRQHQDQRELQLLINRLSLSKKELSLIHSTSTLDDNASSEIVSQPIQRRRAKTKQSGFDTSERGNPMRAHTGIGALAELMYPPPKAHSSLQALSDIAIWEISKFFLPPNNGTLIDDKQLEKIRLSYFCDESLFEIGCYLYYSLDLWHVMDGKLDSREVVMSHLIKEFTAAAKMALSAEHRKDNQYYQSTHHVDDKYVENLVQNRLAMYAKFVRESESSPTELNKRINYWLPQLVMKTAHGTLPKIYDIPDNPPKIELNAFQLFVVKQEIGVFGNNSIPVCFRYLDNYYRNTKSSS